MLFKDMLFKDTLFKDTSSSSREQAVADCARA